MLEGLWLDRGIGTAQKIYSIGKMIKIKKKIELIFLKLI